MKFVSCSTGNDRYSGHGYSGIDRFSGTKPPDDAILFTVSGITAIVEQKFREFQCFFRNFDADLSKVGILKLKVIKDLFYFQKIRCIFSFFLVFLHGSLKSSHCIVIALVRQGPPKEGGFITIVDVSQQVSCFQNWLSVANQFEPLPSKTIAANKIRIQF